MGRRKKSRDTSRALAGVARMNVPQILEQIRSLKVLVMRRLYRGRGPAYCKKWPAGCYRIGMKLRYSPLARKYSPGRMPDSSRNSFAKCAWSK